MPNRTIQTELELFKKTGNSTHARWVANELINAQADSKFASIEKQLDVTVGHASGGDIKSGLLWAVIDFVEAKNKLLLSELEEVKAELRKEKKLCAELASAVSGWLALFDRQRKH